MSSKRGRCTVEGAGWSGVMVEVEHIDENTPSSKKSKAPQNSNRGRKPAPKTIEFQVKGSLKSHAKQHALQTGNPVDSESRNEAGEPDDWFESWMQDFNDVALAT
ncbi:hypothetical protein FRC07_013219, partial [Ceratobasidium sp. 392]